MIRLEDFPHPQRRALEMVREVAAEKSCRPYLVGGPVRDLLLGRHDVIDVDVTLEDDSSVFARALAKRITWWQAAEILGISDRSMRRWRERYQKHGYDGLLDRRVGKPSPKRVPVETVELMPASFVATAATLHVPI